MGVAFRYPLRDLFAISRGDLELCRVRANIGDCEQSRVERASVRLSRPPRSIEIGPANEG